VSIRYLKNNKLPALAWLATVDGAGECTVEHGRLVEARDQFFVEGVWNGVFDEAGFEECESFFGSGMVQRSSGEIVFVSSSATVDYLYYRATPEQVVCSNSLPFLLSGLADRLDEFNSEYGHINDSIRAGIERYERKLPTEHGQVCRLMYQNLVLEGNSVREVDKPLPPAFETYEQYRDYFERNLRGMIQNARDSGRDTTLKILSTQSTGYDTTAINAVARNYGVDLAVSVVESKERHGYFKKSMSHGPSDSGEEIGRHLGVHVEPIDRRYFESEPECEYLYWAGLHNCEDMNLHQVKDFVGNGAVLLTGALGEIWYNEQSIGKVRLQTVNDQLERWDLSCHGLSEARLHIGFIHAAAPYIGGRSRKCILSISNSDAMRTWSIGGKYDRPIARRMGEEAGVPRELFGQTKLATIVKFMPPHLPHGPALREEFFDFYRQSRGELRLLYLRATPRINFMLRSVYRSYIKLLRVALFSLEVVMRLTRQRDLDLRSNAALYPRQRYLGQELGAVLYAYCVNQAAKLYRDRQLKPSEYQSGALTDSEGSAC